MKEGLIIFLIIIGLAGLLVLHLFMIFNWWETKKKKTKHWKHFTVDKSGKRTVYFMVDDKECKSPWNPGKCLPSKRFKK